MSRFLYVLLALVAPMNPLSCSMVVLGTTFEVGTNHLVNEFKTVWKKGVRSCSKLPERMIFSLSSIFVPLGRPAATFTRKAFMSATRPFGVTPATLVFHKIRQLEFG